MSLLPTARRILVADDSAHDIELTLAALEQHHLATGIDVVRDGAEALDYLYGRGRYEGRPHGNPTLLLLDLHMPRVGGLEVLRVIKADPDLRTIPVVMLTSSRDARDMTASYELGANSYVIKPADFVEFTEAVRQIGIFWAVVNEAPPVRLGHLR